MKAAFARLFASHGMLLVLLLLSAFFSVATYTEQPSTSEAAMKVFAKELAQQTGAGAKVMIVARAVPEEVHFADRLEQELRQRGVLVVASSKGEPSAARAAMEALMLQPATSASGPLLHAIACTQSTRQWLLFENLAQDFPALGQPRLLTPAVHRWPHFLKGENLLNIANQIAVIAIVAIGMTLVIITGGIDLSVGSLIALSAVLTAVWIRDFAGGLQATPAGMVLVCLAAMTVCALLGGLSGWLITRFALPPFIVTLSMMLVASGVAFTLAEGQSISAIPDTFLWLGRGADWFGLPNAVLLMLTLYGLAHLMMTQMRVGRYFYAVGGNREAAHISGIPVPRVLMLAYLLSGLLAGLGGVVMASQLKSGSATYGNMYELYVIAAVVVGGASLSGGKGKMFGTLIGALTIAVIQNGMNLTNVESYTQKVVLGLVILGAVLLDQWRGQSQGVRH